MLLFLSVAWAGPDRLSARFAMGSAVEDMARTEDGTAVGFVASGNDALVVLDTLRWATTTLAPCSGVQAIAAWDSGTANEFFVGCSDGAIVRIQATGDGGWAIDDTSSGSTTSLDTGDTGGVDSGSTGPGLTLGGPVLGLGVYGGVLYAVVDDGDLPTVHDIDPSTLTELSGSFSSTLIRTDFEDAEIAANELWVAPGDEKVQKVDLATGAVSTPSENLSVSDCRDIVPTSGSTVFLACSTAIVRIASGSNDLSIALDDEDGLSHPTAAALLGTKSSEEGLLAVADVAQGKLFFAPYDANSGFPGAVESTFDTTDEIAEMVSVGRYLIAGTATGDGLIFSDLPWVTAAVTPSGGAKGDSLVLLVASDEAGAVEVRLGGETGALLASGEVASASEPLGLTFAVDGSFVEGDNPLWVGLTTSDGRLGHDVVDVTIDNPPGAVHLQNSSLAVGNSRLVLSFDGLGDADLARYDIYVSTVEFQAMETGGPAYEGPDAWTNPLSLSVVDPAARVEVELSPLTNGTTYYVAVRALDTQGNEGPMSQIISGAPAPTLGAADLAHEDGGFCGTVGTGARPIAWGRLALAMLGMAPWIGRRRRGPVAGSTSRPTSGAGAGLALALFVLGAPAHAAENQINGHFGMRFGPIFYASDAMTQVYGTDGNDILWIEAGPSWPHPKAADPRPNDWDARGIAQLDFGLGRYRKTAVTLIDPTLEPSGDDVMFQAFPLTAGATLRLDLFRNQPIVPFGRLGGDYWFWQEKAGRKATDTTSTDTSSVTSLSDLNQWLSTVGGGKAGWHWAAGAGILLDAFAPGRASLLQARTGIDDTYLMAEWRQQTVGQPGQGLVFDAKEFTIGLELDF